MTMKFDGSSLDEEKTPKFYDMLDGDMIEVYIEKEEQEETPVAAMTVTSKDFHGGQTPVEDPKILLTLRRQKGRSRKDILLGLGQGEALSTLMKIYKEQLLGANNSSNNTGRRRSPRGIARAKNDADTELLFRFDGTILDLTKTPADYNLVQGNQIDIVEASSVVSPPSNCTGSRKRKSVPI